MFSLIRIGSSVLLLLASSLFAQEAKRLPYGWRLGEEKQKLLKANGGNEQTEAAVAQALEWLAKQQKKDGFWEYDGKGSDHRVAATGMCLLPFLAAGETNQEGKKYKEVVARGLNWLKTQLKADGELHSDMYAQAIATIALCEAAGMTGDERLKILARKSVDYIVKAQGRNGSWGYRKNNEGDTSITGWQIQALKSAKLADIPIPMKTFDQAVNYLKSVSSEEESRYGYRLPDTETPALTAVGLLCRFYLGWTPRNASYIKGAEWLAKTPPDAKGFNAYYLYYATQVVQWVDGPLWHRDWNPKLQKTLLDLQVTDKTPNAKKEDIGSWPKDSDPSYIGVHCGKLGTTALCCLTLQVYYRFPPLHKRDEGGLKSLEMGDK